MSISKEYTLKAMNRCNTIIYNVKLITITISLQLANKHQGDKVQTMNHFSKQLKDVTKTMGALISTRWIWTTIIYQASQKTKNVHKCYQEVEIVAWSNMELIMSLTNQYLIFLT